MIIMKRKDFNEISITEITQKAGVSRMAFYRNYKSKEDIIINYIDALPLILYSNLSLHIGK